MHVETLLNISNEQSTGYRNGAIPGAFDGQKSTKIDGETLEGLGQTRTGVRDRFWSCSLLEPGPSLSLYRLYTSITS